MKKLLIVISNLSYGGAEIQTLELANGLIDLEYAIDVVVLDNRQDIIEKARPEICFHVMNKKSYLDFAVVKKLRNIIKDKKPDVTLCVNLYPLLYLRFALGGKVSLYRTATVLHSTLPRDLKERFKRWYLVPIAKSTSQLIFVSKNQMEYWLKKWKLDREKSAVIHNGINIERFASCLENEEEIQNLKKGFGYSDNDNIIGTCSNFRREKRHKDLVQVCARLKEKGYPVKLILIGDGYMRQSIEDHIRSLGLENEVVITGFVTDVRPYLACVDIFILTSDSVETLSIAAIESQAMKKAAVLSNIGGASEIVNDGINGYLYPACDVDILMKKLETILQEKKWKAMGEAGYRHVCEYFHKDKMVQSYDRLFQFLGSQ